VPDTLAFLDAVEGLPEQLELAHRSAGAIDPAAFGSGADVDQILVLGMGGSGIAGDVLAAAANDSLERPVAVLKQYRVPKWVGERTLAFALSYSGTTEETVSMAEAAAARGARLVAVSRGGDLAELAAACGGLHVECPDGYLPRAAIGALVAPIYVALFRMRLLPNAHDELVAAGAQLARRRDQCARHVEGARNEAREVARKIGRTIPLVYGGGALGGVAAYRWKCDVNENAKAPAFWNQYPEIDHNEICGFGQHGDVTRQLLTLVELRHGFEHERLRLRFSATREIVEECVHQVLAVEAGGEGRLAQLLDLMYVGDWTSTYLALQNDVDPGPIPAISGLKDVMGGQA
jgi:glucose/mannose-6-phosphate isomerase